MLSLQIDYTMLKLSLSIKVNLEEIIYYTKVQRKKIFQVFAAIMIFLLVIEVICVYTSLE